MLSIPCSFFIVVAYSETSTKALSASHPTARLAIELSNTINTTDSLHFHVSILDKNQFIAQFEHGNYTGTGYSDSCSNTSSLGNSTSNIMSLIRFAKCTDATALLRLKFAEWWCQRPVFYKGFFHVLPLATTLSSIPFETGCSEGQNISDTHIGALSLSMLKLERSPIDWLSLAGMSSLHQLVLENSLRVSGSLREFLPYTRLVMIGLYRLDQLESLDGLASCTELRHLRVHLCPRLRDLAVIRQLTRLTELDIGDLAITSFVSGEDDALIPSSGSSRGEDGRLEVVNLANCPNLVDLRFLRHHPRIAHISISHLPINHINWLRSRDKLRWVMFHSLPELRLNYTRLPRILDLTFLMCLIVDKPHPENDLGMLTQCLSLEELQLRSWNHKVEWSLIGQLRYLESLKLSDNSSLNDLSWIQKCIHLRDLNISINLFIQDFSPIAALGSLKQLNLSATKVTDDHIATIAAGCKGLQHVILDNCRLLSNLSPLGQLSDLRVFSAINTRITSISWIVNCARVKRISLKKCTELSDKSPLDRLPRLMSCEL